MIEIRAAGAADAETLSRLRAASLIEQGHLSETERDVFTRRATGDITRLFADGRLVAMLLLDGTCGVGSACATYFERLPFPDGTLHAELSGVYVEPAYRGAGHGTRLVSAVVEAMRVSGARRTFLRPSPGARTLYARLGFVDDRVGVMTLA
ncbi:MAG TPA: GNAT family N-acetyltransferase [Candidatus Elarobacter sp.]|nr:GNAT family N-acetyltransferase [Candidatus Elarobacter sp.]